MSTWVPDHLTHVIPTYIAVGPVVCVKSMDDVYIESISYFQTANGVIEEKETVVRHVPVELFSRQYNSAGPCQPCPEGTTSSDASYSCCMYQTVQLKYHLKHSRPCVPPNDVPILLISCSFWENVAKSYVGAPCRVGAPISGTSWIRHCEENF